MNDYLNDLVYVNNESPQKFSVEKTNIVSIHFSDRDTVKFRLQNK